MGGKLRLDVELPDGSHHVFKMQTLGKTCRNLVIMAYHLSGAANCRVRTVLLRLRKARSFLENSRHHRLGDIGKESRLKKASSWGSNPE